jgi:YfiH family protein
VLILKSILAVVTTKSFENMHLINWPTPKVLAFSTTRFSPEYEKPASNLQHNKRINVQEPSSLEFEYFNLGDHVGDCAKSVERNRTTLLSYLPKNTKIQWLEQVHGSQVAVIDEHKATAIVADAAITRNKGIALAIMTADCLPILLVDKNGNEIAAIHAGWRPLSANIIKKTVNEMNASEDNIVAWLGPCISRNAFEVGEEVKNIFTDISTRFSVAFTPLSPSKASNQPIKFLADLVMIAKLQLKELGIDNISSTNACTFAESDKYYSYRREGKTGRMASVIALV